MGIRAMFPFWSAITAGILAQFIKPFIYYFRKRKWKWKMAFDSGGFPSSHSALVSALALSIGLQENFSSTMFATALTLAVIVIYDAANVRYYSGQNIKITQQLVKDVQETLNTEFDDPIYSVKIKNVLGHKWVEVIGGILLGCCVSLFYHYTF
ncbi:MAG: divergent PAP2 family protein [Erysipelotrichaceae bacterium]|nr:divergent PAP2 family protein [Solobacterium sp.]MDO4192096.1 divergent PAP2 family protein [Erysipelotrichaceae bacterium]MDO5122193.1 divergent PAP2 family protein [Erysipelotrichaceae bacterium]